MARISTLCPIPSFLSSYIIYGNALERFYGSLIKFEAEERNLKVEEIEKEYHDTRGKFILAEGARE